MHAELWEAALNAPDDDRPRQVLADWLIGRGDPLGELINLQLRQASLGPHFEPDAAARLAELATTHAQQFRARFLWEGPHLAWDRGLPAGVACSAEAWLGEGEPPIPLHTLELFDVNDDHVRALVERPSTRRLKALRLRAPEGQRWSAVTATALASASLSHLLHLGLFNAFHDSRIAESFFARARLGELTSLDLGLTLGSDPLKPMRVLPSAAPKLTEVSLDEELPSQLAPELARYDTVIFRELYARPEILEVLGPRVALYTSRPEVPADDPRERGPRVGRWQCITPLGARHGLDASFARDLVTGLGALLIRTRSMTCDPESPVEWLMPHLTHVASEEQVLGPIDRGVDSTGEWAVISLASGERLDRVVERGGRLELSPAAHAAAWSKIARWSVKGTVHHQSPLSALWGGPEGLQLLPACGELHWVRSTYKRIGRADFLELSPEAVRGQPLSERSVSWSLAMQVCLTAGIRLLPIESASEMEVLSTILFGPPLDLHGHGLPPPLRQVLQRCLDRDAAKRPVPAELADALTVFENAETRLELAELPDLLGDLDRAREQAQTLLEAQSIHKPMPLT